MSDPLASRRDWRTQMQETLSQEGDEDMETTPIEVTSDDVADTESTEPAEDAVVFNDNENRQIAMLVEAERRIRENAANAAPKYTAPPVYTYEGEDKSKEHWVAILPQAIGLGVLLVVGFVVLFVLGFMVSDIVSSIETIQEETKGIMTISASLWLPLGLSVFLIGFVALRFLPMYVRWHYGFREVTPTAVLVGDNYPKWVFVLRLVKADEVRDTNSILRQDITNVIIRQRFWGRVLDYGTVTYDTNAQTDTPFHGLKYYRRVRKLRKMFPSFFSNK